MKKAVIYVKHKDNSRTSPKSMVEKCQEFAKSKQLEVVDVYCDCVKDNKVRRYDLERLLKDCKKSLFDYVIVVCMANVSRKFTEFCKFYTTLNENGIGLFSVYDEEELKSTIISIGESV